MLRDPQRAHTLKQEGALQDVQGPELLANLRENLINDNREFRPYIVEEVKQHLPPLARENRIEEEQVREAPVNHPVDEEGNDEVLEPEDGNPPD